MCSLEKEGRRNEWGVIIPSPSLKTECLKATGPPQPLYLTPCGDFTTLTGADVRYMCAQMTTSVFLVVTQLHLSCLNLFMLELVFILPWIIFNPRQNHQVEELRKSSPRMPVEPGHSFKVRNLRLSPVLFLHPPGSLYFKLHSSKLSLWGTLVSPCVYSHL